MSGYVYNSGAPSRRIYSRIVGQQEVTEGTRPKLSP